MLTCAAGRVYVTDTPERGYTLAQVARMSLSAASGPILGIASLSAMPFAPIFSTQAAEVKVDPETGTVRVLHFVQAQDVGVAINPMAVEGQIDGGAVQGIGRAITEEVVLKDGKILNPSLTTYLMPMAADVPAITNILVQVPTADGPFGARAVANRPASGPQQRSPMPSKTRWACVSKSCRSAPRRSSRRCMVRPPQPSRWSPVCYSSCAVQKGTARGAAAGVPARCPFRKSLSQ